MGTHCVTTANENILPPDSAPARCICHCHVGPGTVRPSCNQRVCGQPSAVAHPAAQVLPHWAELLLPAPEPCPHCRGKRTRRQPALSDQPAYHHLGQRWCQQWGQREQWRRRRKWWRSDIDAAVKISAAQGRGRGRGRRDRRRRRTGSGHRGRPLLHHLFEVREVPLCSLLGAAGAACPVVLWGPLRAECPQGCGRVHLLLLHSDCVLPLWGRGGQCVLR